MNFLLLPVNLTFMQIAVLTVIICTATALGLSGLYFGAKGTGATHILPKRQLLSYLFSLISFGAAFLAFLAVVGELTHTPHTWATFLACLLGAVLFDTGIQGLLVQRSAQGKGDDTSA